MPSPATFRLRSRDVPFGTVVPTIRRRSKARPGAVGGSRSEAKRASRQQNSSSGPVFWKAPNDSLLFCVAGGNSSLPNDLCCPCDMSHNVAQNQLTARGPEIAVANRPSRTLSESGTMVGQTRLPHWPETGVWEMTPQVLGLVLRGGGARRANRTSEARGGKDQFLKRGCGEPLPPRQRSIPHPAGHRRK